MISARLRQGGPGGGIAVFYLFALPFAALTLVFGLWPIALGIEVSFTESATALKPFPNFVGLANYFSVFADPLFVASLWRTLLYAVLAVIANVGLALAVALLLNSRLIGPGRTVFKLLLFLPVVTPDVAGYVVWRWLYDQSFGAVNAALTGIGLPAFGGIASPHTAMLAVLLAELWHHAGFYVVIFLANLAICERALEEAADIDGARSWQKTLYVVLPQLRPAIVINTVYALIQFLKTFTVVVVTTKGGPNGATNFLSYYAWRFFDEARYGEATAMGTILFAIVLLVALSVYALGERGRA
ncbi:MAG: carbohydrate ABC transporter permease [Nevskiales bacterium]